MKNIKNIYKDLQKIADTIRLKAYKAIAEAGGGHFGGSLSEIEILTALYFKELRIYAKNPKMGDRDRFILSKGHGGPGFYATLSERGFFPQIWLNELDRSGSRLPKHIDRLKTPGIDVSAGALGQGLSIGVGMALAAKLDATNIRVYVVMGDGECNEGQVWEAAMTASKYHLDNIISIIDRNFLQVDGTSDEVMPLEPFVSKWSSFGWNVVSVDGHNMKEILDAFEIANKTKQKPTVIIARTIKGKGVSFMEGKVEWHSGKLSTEQFKIGVSDLERRLIK